MVKKHVVTFGKGRKRRRLHLRLARTAPSKGNGEPSTAIVAVPAVSPVGSFVSNSDSDTSDTRQPPVMKPLTHTSFTKHAHVVCDANKVIVTRMLDNAAAVVRRVYRDKDPSIIEDDTIVSFNGSWMTRGYNSQYGIGCVVEVLTGLVIDLQVMSLYCQRCAYASTRYGGMATMEFKDRFRMHEPVCNRNYKGASGGMETMAAELLWTLSMNLNFRYTTMLGDGDARTASSTCVCLATWS